MPQMPVTFRSPHLPSKRQVKAVADRRRGSARKRGYTHQWDKASKHNLECNPFCLGCGAVGRDKIATVTDHIIPPKGDMDLFWDDDNWQSVCADHHDIVKTILENEYIAGTIGADQLKLDSKRAIELTNLKM